MGYAVNLEQFEGPLHLLLELIETEKLDVSEVSLAQVTDSYLQHLDDNDDIPPEELTDFLVVASKLLLIKSKLLLPFLFLHDDEDVDDLEKQLKIYKEYLDASKVVEDIIATRRFLYVHEKLPHVEVGFAPPKRLETDQMAEMFREVIRRLEPFVHATSKATIERTVSIHEKIRQIRAMFDRASKTSFREVLSTAQSKTEVIVSFLALLELVKQRSVSVTQSGQFDDITINKLDNVSA